MVLTRAFNRGGPRHRSNPTSKPRDSEVSFYLNIILVDKIFVAANANWLMLPPPKCPLLVDYKVDETWNVSDFFRGWSGHVF